MDLIKVEDIRKTYHLGEMDVPVLKGVSFTIKKGEFVALMGSSGSGKSTLMNILGCLDRPTSGEYWLDGIEVGSLSPNERALVRTQKIGFVFQSFNLLPRTTALNNVLMPLDYSPTPPPPDDAVNRARDLLVRVGLSKRVYYVPSKMSGGQQQRVAVARSMINQPSIILADEPTGNLDSHTSVEILEMFKELNAAGITVILVTHDPKVASHAHRTIRVVDGLLEEDTGSSQPVHTDRAANPKQPLRRDQAHGPAAAHVLVSSPAREEESWSTANDSSFEPYSADLALQPHGSAAATIEVAPRVVATPAQPIPEVDPELPRLHAGLARKIMPATLRTAANALRRNKMRSLLTTLGIVIGITAVIAIVEISEGSKSALVATMSTMGANNLLIQSGAASSGGINWGTGSQKTLTPGDAAEIDMQCSSIAAVAPLVRVSGQVIHGNRNWVPMNIYGTTPDYLPVRDWTEMEAGDMFTDQDVRGSNKVCVVGTTIVRELFNGQSPLGQDLRVQNVALRVVGVLTRKGANMMGMDQDDIILAPWTTIKYRVSANNSGGASQGVLNSSATTGGSISTKTNSLNSVYPGGTALYPQQSEVQAANNPRPVRFTQVDQILAKAQSAGDIPEAMAEISSLLRERHHLNAEENDDFNIRDMSEMVKAMGSMSNMMGALLLIVALISLVVGGVGIMNIMLVSVTERTREIGLRMAVGARGYQILRQFLIEAIVLCLLGGVVGIGLGRLSAWAVKYFMHWPVEPSLPAVVAAFAVSATVGIAFGFYPAWKASRLDPIEALRYE